MKVSRYVLRHMLLFVVAHVFIQTSQDATISELKQMLSKRDAESSRLRELRDQYSAEINERKMKEQTKLASVLEFKTLAENRAVCMAIREGVFEAD